MAKKALSAYSRYSHDAVELLSKLIRAGRKERKLTAQELADRAGVSRGLIQRIEKGDMKCQIGAYFEVAAILGIPLFESDGPSLRRHITQQNEKLALLPKSIQRSRKAVDDAF